MSGRGDASKPLPAALHPPSLTCHALLHCNVGPSDAARAKGILKRQKKAGTALFGWAAKLKRRADLRARGVDDEKILDDLTAAVGLPGQAFYVNDSKGHKLPELPSNMQVRVWLGERDARAAVRTYHAHTRASAQLAGSHITVITRNYVTLHYVTVKMPRLHRNAEPAAADLRWSSALGGGTAP